MNGRFVEILKLHSTEEANEVIKVLHQHGIPFQLNKETIGAGEIFPTAFVEKEILLSVREEDEQTAKNLFLSIRESADDEIQIPLSDMSNEELIEITTSSDEWGTDMVREANRLLKKRGYSDFKKLETLKAKRVQQKQKGVKADRTWMTVGFLSALLAGPLGIIMGYYYLTLKEKDKTGKQYHYFDTDTRKAGLVMLLIGIVQFISVLFIKLQTVFMSPW